MAQSWCDKLASTPVVGIFLEPHSASSGAIMDALSPLLDRHYAGDRALFSIDQSQGNVFVFTTDEGYQTNVEPTRLSVRFVHRLRTRQVSAGPPVAELISKAAPYTQLLKGVLERLLETANLLPGPTKRAIRRVGIVSETAVLPEEAPPGIRRFANYVEQPWKSGAQAFAFSMTTNLDNGAGWTDRCIHTITKPEGDNLMNLSFDWQRVYADGRSVSALAQLVKDCERAALAYFEELAVGDRFDADDVSSKA